MKSTKFLHFTLVAGLLAAAGTSISATSASAGALDVFTPSPSPSTASSATPAADPNLDSASARVDSAKIKLDQARQQLKAAKAMLKACEAETRAAQADKQALAARHQATQLADASGLKDNGAKPIQPDASINNFAANNPVPATPAASTDGADLSKTRIQQPDVNGQPAEAAGQAAAPAGDLNAANPALRDANSH